MLNRRSNAFEEYLRRQEPTRRAELIAAEKRYAAAHSAHLASYEETYRDIMHGYEDTPAGRNYSQWLPLGTYLSVLDNNGDWAWKPQRDKAVGDNLQTFRGVPRSAAELSHTENSATGTTAV